jgi:hypothetical protein
MARPIVNHRWMARLLAGALMVAWPSVGERPCSAADESQPAELTFEKDVLPILEARCLKCHSGDAPKAGLDLRGRTLMLRGGKSGSAIKIGSAQSSLIWEKVVADQMPPEGQKLTAEEKATVRAWIDMGAKGEDTLPADLVDPNDVVSDDDRNFWSFKPPVRPPAPSVQSADRVRNPIDAFILAALEAQGLRFSAEADRVTLIRRASVDLIGLPPTPQDVDAFLADTAEGAYERLIERLLASPHYGERWGRHWLDAAGYADSEGILDADYVRTAAWRYRDYVIRAFNSDKPYDRYLQEQIAGDELTDYWTAFATQAELPPETVEAVVATGFLRCASDTSRPDFAQIKNAPGYYYQTLDDTLKIVVSSTMGLTVQCAKCHSHKYDPIPQADYYRLQAVFMGAYRPAQWVPQVERRLLEATQSQQAAAAEHNGKLDQRITELRQEIDALKAQFGQRLFDERLAKLPEPIREDLKTALATDPAQRNEVQKYLAEKFQAELRPDPEPLAKALAETYPDYATGVQEREKLIAAEDARRVVFPEIRALYDLAGEPQSPLLLRGDYRTPGPPMTPGVLTALTTEQPFAWTPPAADAKTSGRRLALARWLTQPNHPLTARVMVNRIWRHHFGEGIVATLDDFGNTGSGPSHPELLDWLATEFVAQGWSVKQMHRLMMTSSAYRQQSAYDPATHAVAHAADPENRLLWRQRLRRLEAEPLRDAMLAVAGALNREMFGPPVGMQRQADGEVTAPNDASGNRRSIYLQVRRSQPLTLLQVFDQPVMETNCAQRGQSTVSLQALALLNSDFLSAQAVAFADRALSEAPVDPLGHALRMAFAREPTDGERQRLTAFVDQQAARHAAVVAAAQPAAPEQMAAARRQALADFCQMLLAANEFAYID